MTAPDIRRTIDAVWRDEAAKLIAGLARIVRDVGQAEEFAQDALVAALEHWPRTGIPDSPGAWLMATAKRRAIDHFRRRAMMTRKQAEIEREAEDSQTMEPVAIEDRLDDQVGDEVLGLMFVSCHPVLSMDSRVALTLRLIGGLTTDEIAHAYLAPEATIAQRIVRAKRRLSESGVRFEMPRDAELMARLPSVLEVIYLIFNEGYAATAGDDWMRPTLCQEALRLGRMLAGIAPGEAEVHGLVALMEIQASRFGARSGPDGSPILLADQDRTKWDGELIRSGLASLDRAGAVEGAVGVYTLQAAIAACHARAGTADETDWREIARLYAVLGALAPSPVIELNRAVAVGLAEGPEAGLAILEPLEHVDVLRQYHHLPAVRGDLLYRLGRYGEAAVAFEQAVSLTRNARERAVLDRRAAECRSAVDSAASRSTA